MTPTDDVYAVPGEQSIIDIIDPVTGLTSCFGHTLAQVQERYPGAVRLRWEDWQTDASTRQRTPITWDASTAKQFDDMLNVLPPIAWNGRAFLVGEPTDHDILSGRPRFTAYWQRNGGYYVSSRPLTVAEFRSEIGR